MIEDYYNQLAPYYRLVYQDWDASIEHQATSLAGIIHEFSGSGVYDVLDAACGIGTQCIGSAQRGYRMTATDSSPAAIAVAREETMRRRLRIFFDAVNMRNLAARFSVPFDLIIACDNAIPHMLSDDQIQLAFAQFYQCTRPAGGCIISLRDYGGMEQGGTRIIPRHVHRVEHGRIVVFDVWEFAGDFYDFTTYVVEDDMETQPTVHAFRGGRYYCVALPKVEQRLLGAGFRRVEIVRDGFFPPLLVGAKG